jgi:glycine cleavage system H protein
VTPEDLKYTPDHEWIATLASGTVRVGITDFAQDQLGDVVFVQLPEVGAAVAAKDPVGEVESTKSVSEIYAPVAGEVTAVNDALTDTPELMRSPSASCSTERATARSPIRHEKDLGLVPQAS